MAHRLHEGGVVEGPKFISVGRQAFDQVHLVFGLRPELPGKSPLPLGQQVAVALPGGQLLDGAEDRLPAAPFHGDTVGVLRLQETFVIQLHQQADAGGGFGAVQTQFVGQQGRFPEDVHVQVPDGPGKAAEGLAGGHPFPQARDRQEIHTPPRAAIAAHSLELVLLDIGRAPYFWSSSSQQTSSK